MRSTIPILAASVGFVPLHNLGDVLKNYPILPAATRDISEVDRTWEDRKSGI
jgi:hypothetical protein